jgi:hypothetical protein
MFTRTGLAAALTLVLTLLLCPPSLDGLRSGDSAVVAADIVFEVVKFVVLFVVVRTILGVIGGKKDETTPKA